jgi:hypothetical protein
MRIQKRRQRRTLQCVLVSRKKLALNTFIPFDILASVEQNFSIQREGVVLGTVPGMRRIKP